MSGSISLTTYLSPYKPIPSSVPGWDEHQQATWPATTATLITAGPEAVLVDALMTVAEGEQLASWISGLGRPALAAIYVTHAHADHFFGATSILPHFPSARLVSRPEIAAAAREQVSPENLGIWNSFFAGQIAEHPAVPEALESDLVLAGHPLRAIDAGHSDVPASSVLHIPELGTVVCGDVAYNGIHMWLAGSTPASRRKWLEALDAIDKLGPSTVIAGHKDPGAPNDDAARVLDESRQYLQDFDQAAAGGSPADIIAAVMARHGDRGNPYTLWFAAHNLPPA
jgi:glyoxylase-like metal-dependent hydrolase (beta-lactamase superfamily II)